MSLASRERRDLERVARNYTVDRESRPFRVLAKCAHEPRWNAEERRYACAQCGRLLRAIELSVGMAGR